MTRRCTQCPQTDDAITEKIHSLIGEYEEDDTVKFLQWVHVDREELLHCKESIPSYADMIIKQLNKLVPHSSIAKCQTRYLKKQKEEIDDNTASVSGDFAQNYSFVVQDEIQGYHWNNLQCTLHPVVVYYKKGQDLSHISYCILSDDLEHTIHLVYVIQKKVIQDLKTRLPNITSLEYYSDGCGGQYKNRKNFLNLCLNKQDFNLTAKWYFFATSHGKQPCDGIGGTVKCLAAKHSLQNDVSNHILNPQQMFDFCQQSIK